MIKIANSILCSLLFLTSCCLVIAKMNLSGSLIYGGQGIYALDLSSRESRIIHQALSLSVSGISEIDENRILISSYNLEPSRQRDKIAIYNFQSDRLINILDGSRAVYIPNFNKVVFYNKGCLSIADINDLDKSVEIIDCNSTAYPAPVVPISCSEFVYERLLNGVYSIWKYDFRIGKSEELFGIKNCSLSKTFWRGKTKQLLCSERLKDGSYTGNRFFTNLEGVRSETVFITLINKEDLLPVIYIESLDSAVLLKEYSTLSRPYLQYQVWLYDFGSQSKIKISDNTILGGRLIVYREAGQNGAEPK